MTLYELRDMIHFDFENWSLKSPCHVPRTQRYKCQLKVSRSHIFWLSLWKTLYYSELFCVVPISNSADDQGNKLDIPFQLVIQSYSYLYWFRHVSAQREWRDWWQWLSLHLQAKLWGRCRGRKVPWARGVRQAILRDQPRQVECGKTGSSNFSSLKFLQSWNFSPTILFSLLPEP